MSWCFMRDVRSRVYFEQMKGRGTRVSLAYRVAGRVRRRSKGEDALRHRRCRRRLRKRQDRFTTARSKADEKLESMLLGVALGKRDEDTLTTLGSATRAHGTGARAILGKAEQRYSDRRQDSGRNVARSTPGNRSR